MKLFGRKKKLKDNESFNVTVFHKKTGHAEDLTIYNTFEQGFSETFDELDWSLSTALYADKLYLTTLVTDHFLFITHQRCKFVFEMNNTTLDYNTVTNEQVADLMYNTLVRSCRRPEEPTNIYDDSANYPVVALIDGNNRFIFQTDEFRFFREK